VVDTAVRKCAILAAGARRRRGSDEADRYLELARVATAVGGDWALPATNDAGQAPTTSGR
jgi:hypothetical protein